MLFKPPFHMLVTPFRSKKWHPNFQSVEYFHYLHLQKLENRMLKGFNSTSTSSKLHPKNRIKNCYKKKNIGKKKDVCFLGGRCWKLKIEKSIFGFQDSEINSLPFLWKHHIFLWIRIRSRWGRRGHGVVAALWRAASQGRLKKMPGPVVLKVM